VAVGKAHIVVLTKDGDIFTFGMNNKGQCGREFPPPKEPSNADPAQVPDD
jgi:E3 ubiquitin-protein ligase MYCBP2